MHQGQISSISKNSVKNQMDYESEQSSKFKTLLNDILKPEIIKDTFKLKKKVLELKYLYPLLSKSERDYFLTELLNTEKRGKTTEIGRVVMWTIIFVWECHDFSNFLENEKKAALFEKCYDRLLLSNIEEPTGYDLNKINHSFGHMLKTHPLNWSNLDNPKRHHFKIIQRFRESRFPSCSEDLKKALNFSPTSITNDQFVELKDYEKLISQQLKQNMKKLQNQKLVKSSEEEANLIMKDFDVHWIFLLNSSLENKVWEEPYKALIAFVNKSEKKMLPSFTLQLLSEARKMFLKDNPPQVLMALRAFVDILGIPNLNDINIPESTHDFFQKLIREVEGHENVNGHDLGLTLERVKQDYNNLDFIWKLKPQFENKLVIEDATTKHQSSAKTCENREQSEDLIIQNLQKDCELLHPNAAEKIYNVEPQTSLDIPFDKTLIQNHTSEISRDSIKEKQMFSTDEMEAIKQRLIMKSRSQNSEFLSQTSVPITTSLKKAFTESSNCWLSTIVPSKECIVPELFEKVSKISKSTFEPDTKAEKRKNGPVFEEIKKKISKTQSSSSIPTNSKFPGGKIEAFLGDNFTTEEYVDQIISPSFIEQGVKLLGGKVVMVFSHSLGYMVNKNKLGKKSSK